MTNSYIVDHLSVLMVKKDYGMQVDEELKQFRELYSDMCNANPPFAIPLTQLLGEMYAYNKLMYPIHDALMGTAEGVEGEFYLDDKEFRYLTENLLKLNARRVEARSEVAKMFDEPTEYKTYA